MHKMPALSSKELVKLLERAGALCVRQGATDHAIFARTVNNKRYAAPVQMGKKSLDPGYCKRVLKQLQFTSAEIEQLLSGK